MRGILLRDDPSQGGDAIMCGILGIVGQDGSPQQRRTHISAMAERLAHRGPDDFGAFLDDRAGVALAHHRLSILDLSSNGRQPMSTDDGRWTITFNGEIYNHCELRQQLSSRGFTFASTSDTEVLLKGYEAWGPQVLDRLIGMFAFGIWDAREQSLFLARDRVGKKPLVYFVDGKKLAFASELKALLALPGCEATLNPDALDAYLALGYVPAPLTIFRRLSKLPPGHWLTWRDGRIDLHRYWQPENTNESAFASNDQHHVEQFQERFRSAVGLRLRADVPVGLFLSGGVDSSVIAAECADLGKSVDALTVVFDHDDTDLPHARAVARHFGLRHEVLQASGANVVRDLEKLHWCYDEPFADSSSLPCYYIARHARGHFKVILTGDGGDEAFAGYPHYEFVAAKQHLKRWAAAFGLRDGNFHDPWSTYFQSKALFRRSRRRELLPSGMTRRSGFTKYLEDEPYLRACRPSSALQLALWADRHVYLPNDLLYKTDIALMSQGIEGRSPFLDHRLLEWTQQLPPKQLVQARSKKRLLRTAYRDRLPQEILQRRKHGFGSPMMAWLCGPLAPVLKEQLPSPLLNAAPQRALLAKFSRKPTARLSRQLWTLLTFSIWAKQWGAAW
jgi:asparagine synthase (glutamine-hydrolysing)